MRLSRGGWPLRSEGLARLIHVAEGSVLTADVLANSGETARLRLPIDRRFAGFPRLSRSDIQDGRFVQVGYRLLMESSASTDTVPVAVGLRFDLCVVCQRPTAWFGRLGLRQAWR